MWHRQQWRTSRLVMNWRMRKTSAERFRKVTVVHSTRDFSTRFLSLPRLIRSPVLRKRSFAHNNIVSSFSSFNSLSLTSVNRHFRNFSTWSSFSPKGSVAMLISWKCPHNNMRGEKHQISPRVYSGAATVAASWLSNVVRDNVWTAAIAKSVSQTVRPSPKLTHKRHILGTSTKCPKLRRLNCTLSQTPSKEVLVVFGLVKFLAQKFGNFSPVYACRHLFTCHF